MLVAATPAYAQQAHYDSFVLSRPSSDGFGYSVGFAGDVNNDGTDDFIVGGLEQAHVISGADFSPIWNFPLESDRDAFFQRNISTAGDLNNDGHADVIVGSPRDPISAPASEGTVTVYSGIDGQELFDLSTTQSLGNPSNHNFGHVVGPAGDINGDNTPDVFVAAEFFSAPDPNNPGVSSLGASVELFSGVDGSLLSFHLEESAIGVYDGLDVIDDRDNNGSSEIVAWNREDSAVEIISGSDPAGIQQSFIVDEFVGSFFPPFLLVSDAGDLNDDGTNDIALSDDADDSAGNNTGKLVVISGVDASILLTATGSTDGEQFGISHDGIGDANGDGVEDIAVGSWRIDKLSVISGVDGSEIFAYTGSRFSSLGTTTRALGDINGDGLGDFICTSKDLI